jgi:cytoskeletal protein CcmA (bactofilin family)
MKQKTLIISALVLAVFATAVAAQRVAGTIIMDEPVFSDQYLAGRVIRVSAPIEGDLVVAGRRLLIDTEIDGDLIAAGETVDLRGTVTDDVRAAGRAVTVRTQVAGHLVAAGAEVVLEAGSTVADWAWLAGQDVRVAGQIGQELRAAADSVVVSANVRGDAVLTGARIRLEPGAVIRGDLIWQGPAAPEIAAGATIAGEIIQSEQLDGFSGMGRFGEEPGIGGTIVFTAALIAAVVAMFALFPRFSGAAAERVRETPLRTLGTGLAVAAGTPIAIVLLFVTGIGFIVGLGLLGSYLLLLLFAVLFGVVTIGHWGLALGGRSRTAGRGIQMSAMALASIAFLLIARIPLLGGVVVFLVLAGGLGAVSGELWQRYRQPASLESS